MIKNIAFFCYPVSDVARSRRFYEEPLGEMTTTPVCRFVIAQDPDGNDVILHHCNS